MRNRRSFILSSMLFAVVAATLNPLGVRVAVSQEAELNYPLAVAVDRDDNIFIVDRNLPGVWKVAGSELSIYFQASKQLRTPLNVPRCAAIDRGGRLCVGCSPTRDVYRFDEQAKPHGLTGGGAEGIGIPMGVAVNSAGDLLVSDLERGRIRKVPASGGKAEEFAIVAAPRGVATDGKDQLWVVTGSNDQLIRITSDGKAETVVKGRTFQYPSDVAVDSKGNAYVCDSYAKTIWRVPPGGEPMKWVEGDPLIHPVGLAWRGANLLVADPRAKAIFEITPDGKLSKLEMKQ